MRKKRAAILATGGVLATSFVAGGLAYAASIDIMYPTANTSWECQDNSALGYNCRTDNSTLTLYREFSLSNAGKANIYNTVHDEFGLRTDLTLMWPAAGDYDGASETDIIYQRGALGSVPGSDVAITWCDDESSEDLCDQHYVFFEDTYTLPEYVCHETGHAVGLTHGANAGPAIAQQDDRLECMTKAPISDTLMFHDNDLPIPAINNQY